MEVETMFCSGRKLPPCYLFLIQPFSSSVNAVTQKRLVVVDAMLAVLFLLLALQFLDVAVLLVPVQAKGAESEARERHSYSTR